MHYGALGQPEEIVGEDGIATRFIYAPDGSRYKQERAGKTIYYIGGDFEYTINADGTIEKRSYVQDYAVIERDDGERRVRYLHRDRQGSIAAITNESGHVIERHGYDAFGTPLTSERRDEGGRLHGDKSSTAAGCTVVASCVGGAVGLT